MSVDGLHIDGSMQKYGGEEFQIGVGMRGAGNFKTVTKYNPKNVYIKCLRCDNEWNMKRADWEANLPSICPVCLGQALVHEWAVVGAFESVLRRASKTGLFVVVDISNDVIKSTGIQRLARIQSII